MVVWAVISWHSVGPIITLHGRITAREYVDRLGNQVCPMIQMLFLNNDAVFQDDSTPTFTQLELFSHGLEHMKVNFIIVPGLYNHQISTSLNHSGQFWKLQ
jgi:hypothetical protein